ncbi:hemolysin family protein [Nocardioides daphniae]|uniref:Membrane protein n=1 Tax=Nocardioides daphniae TaxID=402297 RepID=A0ABQ1QL28_9ACTN|nr:hemolysin family protein [Nocardioides daphniae]GGD29788.1 membrane protein [Nocardioides daphniae]
MSGVSLLVTVVVLVLLASLLSAADSALGQFSRARAADLADERRAGARALGTILDEPARYLSTILLLRIACEVAAVVGVALWVHDLVHGRWWTAALTSAGAMTVVSFVLVGVAPRTLGRQHDATVALAAAGPVVAVTRVLGPLPQFLILLGNAITPGRGFRRGPFASETELRELVDLAEASHVIEEGERRMIHSVFELGDTICREVMVPRPDMVWIERHKNLRQATSLFLRSGYSRIPVVGENLDDVVGVAYFKDVVRRDFDDPEIETTMRVDEVMRDAHFVPDTVPADALLAEMQARREHLALVVDEYGGTTGLVTIEDVLEEIVGEITDEYDVARHEAEVVEGGTRVSARYSVDDLVELFGISVIDDEVDTVGGLLAKHLGRVPLPGAVVQVHGLRFEAEEGTGRRNRIGTVLVSPVEVAGDDDKASDDVEEDEE